MVETGQADHVPLHSLRVTQRRSATKVSGRHAEVHVCHTTGIGRAKAWTGGKHTEPRTGPEQCMARGGWVENMPMRAGARA